MMSNNSFEEYRERFLDVLGVIERYQYFLFRRSIGILYLSISATISIFLILVLSIIKITSFWISLIIFFSMVLLVFIVVLQIINNVFGVLKIYGFKRLSGKNNMFIWIFLVALAGAISSLQMFSGIPQYIAPLATQISIGLGNISNYYASKTSEYYPGKVEREYLYFGIILIISSILIPIFPEYGWFIVTIFALLGTYIFGLYIVLTADKVFG